ncbi:hypothetical protein HYV43_02870 [Candidatus Micrarchaeota archaeon]|nr:hypothetical protein [Candidatus Micrarchaeota archaeon]
MNNIFLIFTRDFDQWEQELISNILVKELPSLWGKGITNQLVRFTGRTSEWYRFEDDMAAFKQYMAAKPLDSDIFSEKTQEEFRQDVKHLRELFTREPSEIETPTAHLAAVTEGFNRMYRLYPLALFLPGPWRDAFLAAHAHEIEQAQAVIERLVKSRHESEGLVKETGLYLRRWLEPLLEKNNYPPQYVRLLSVAEVRQFIEKGTLPARMELEERAQGYVYFQGKITPTQDFPGFLQAHQLKQTTVNETGTGMLKGTVACKGGKIKGKVHIIMNTYEVSRFKPQSILVTPMTSPEYLPAMKTAIAIITDEGGLTCHAAITARELGVPCIIGTKTASKWLKDGDQVEVDARKGTIRKTA